MMRIVTVAEMRTIEREGFAAGVSYDQMITTVGGSVASLIVQKFTKCSKRILGLIGKGNNGKDTLAALAHLRGAGWETVALLTFEADPQELHMEAYLASGGTVRTVSPECNFDETRAVIRSSKLILDGVYGIGFHLPLDQTSKALFDLIREERSADAIVLALDCPSGTDCTSGEADAATLPADHTFVIEALKMGQIISTASKYLGEIIPISLNLPENLPVYQQIQRQIVTNENVRAALPERKNDGNKGTFGTVSIFGGSKSYPGAPVLAGMAAYRVGCGLVRMVVPQIVQLLNGGNFIEAVWDAQDTWNIEKIDSISQQILSKPGAILIGPGLATGRETSEFVLRLIESIKMYPQPLVIDADGLNILSEAAGWRERLSQNCVLTPHPGEMARLCETTVAEVQKNRVEMAETLARQIGAVIVLKGAFSIIASPEGDTFVMPYANASLAKAGTGDVLAGLIAGFSAQRVPVADAARLAVWIHAMAAENVFASCGQSFSPLASDIIAAVPHTIRDLIASVNPIRER